jgi:lipopolysaccharide export system permease protein
MRRTINLYLLRELLPSFSLGLAGFTFVLLTGRILQLTELFVNKGIPLSFILKFLYCLLPSFLVLTIPMATLLSVLTAFHRLSSDNEMTALKASGVSLYQLIGPVLGFAFAAYLATSFLSLESVPQANAASRSLLFEMARSRAYVGVRERVFNDDFDGIVLYVDQIKPRSFQWDGVFVSDARNPSKVNTIVAQEGEILSDPEKLTVTLRLRNGSIHRLGDEPDSYQKIDFKTYDLRLDLKTELRSQKAKTKNLADMSLHELGKTLALLRSHNADTKPLWIKIHEKFSIPFACLVFGILGIPLGLQYRSARAGRSRGFSYAIGVILVYYLLTNAGTSLAERGVILLEVGMWGPNAIFLAAGIYLLIKAANESPVWLLVWIGKKTGRIRKKMRDKGLLAK